MTVETTERKQTFLGGQSALTFSFRTLVSNPEYIKMKVQEISTGTLTDLVYNVDFTVAVNSNGTGGVVTVSPTYSTLFNYVVYRETVPLQSDEYDDFNQFPASTLENSLDRTIMIAQEQAEETSRTLRYPIGANFADAGLPNPLANAFLQWNATGDALINAVIPDPSTLVKASDAEAVAGVEDTHFMTAAKTKTAINDRLDTDNTLAGNSDSKVATQKAIKSFVVTTATTKLSKTTAAEIQAMTEKTSTTDNDLLLIEDSADSFNKKKIKVSNFLPTSSTSAITGNQLFTSSGSFTAPAGVTKVFISMIGGGGGGGAGSGNNRGAGGGAAGRQVLLHPYTVVPGASYTITIGAGGSGGSGGTVAGSTGGTTTFDTFSVTGGASGAAGTNAGTSAGGTASSPNGVSDGAGGVSAVASGSGGSSSTIHGGGGGGSAFGTGGDGGSNGVDGSNASANTGGGGGGCGAGTQNGGSGGSGICLVQW